MEEWMYGSMFSLPPHLLKVSGQLHAPATLLPGKESPVPRAGLGDMEKWKFFTLLGLMQASAWIRPRVWWHFLPKRRLTFNRQGGVTSLSIELFIILRKGKVLEILTSTSDEQFRVLAALLSRSHWMSSQKSNPPPPGSPAKFHYEIRS
jgi:hypothetical protein